MTAAVYPFYHRDATDTGYCAVSGCCDPAEPGDVACTAHLALEAARRIDACDGLRIDQRRRALTREADR